MNVTTQYRPVVVAAVFKVDQQEPLSVCFLTATQEQDVSCLKHGSTLKTI